MSDSSHKPAARETLRQVADPDDVVDHYPSACSWCGAGLDPDTSVGHSARQVFDLPEPEPLVVTEHRAHDCRCLCGAKTRAAFPNGVNAPVQYGTRIGAFVLYLLHYQLLPEKRLVEFDLLEGKLVTATIARISQDCARRFRGFADVVRDHVAAARSNRPSDWRQNTIAASRLHRDADLLSRLRQARQPLDECRRHRRPRPLEALLHDAGRAARLCNTHHLRELKALEIEKEDWRACHAANLARDRGVPLNPSLIVLIERCYDAILAERLAFHEAQASLAQPVKGGRKRRGRTRKQDTLRFPSRSGGALYQQSSRARRAHDEAPAETLRRLSLGRKAR
jgi:transposase